MNKFKLGSDFDHLVNSLSDVELLNLFIQSCSQTTINGVPYLGFLLKKFKTICRCFL